jgi:hypothetical protein
MDRIMLNETCLGLIKSIINTQKDLVVVFKDNIPVMTNKAFNSFLGLSSFEDYISDAPLFIEHFTMHPSYFSKDKLHGEESWFDAILKLKEEDRVVSMINTNYEPRAFLFKMDSEVDNFKIVFFEDITQDLIKRIMIQNNANIDEESGAYTKEYFLQICQNLEDAATFNEKIIGMISISISTPSDLDADMLRSFVDSFNSMIRQDDMLIRWSEDKFIFVYLVDSVQKANLVVLKLKQMINTKLPTSMRYTYTFTFQKEDVQSLEKMLKSL